MRAVIQRVTSCSLRIDNQSYSSIDKGLLILLGIEDADEQSDVEWLCKKIAHLRIFNDSSEIMNLDINEVRGEAMVVSQFTLHASTRKGNRPSYIKASKPITAIPLYESFILLLRSEIHQEIATGVFGADMQIELVNDGPVTIIIDTKLKE